MIKRYKEAKSAREKGMVLVMFAIAIVAIIATVGLCFDVARMFIARHEAQQYVDAAALAAAYELNGFDTGIAAGQTKAVQKIWKQTTFGTENFSETPTVTFCPDQACGSGLAANQFGSGLPGDPSTIRFVRVTLGSDVPIYLIPVLGTGNTSRVAATAVAGQATINGTLQYGSLPYVIATHTTDNGGLGAPDARGAYNYGMELGKWYAFQWGSNAGTRFQAVWTYYDQWQNNPSDNQAYNKYRQAINQMEKKDYCNGDLDIDYIMRVGEASVYNKNNALLDRGAFNWTTPQLQEAVELGALPADVVQGQTYDLGAGVREAVGNTLYDRIVSDSYQGENYYVMSNNGANATPVLTVPPAYNSTNGARIVVIPIASLDYYSDSRTGTILGFRAFMLENTANFDKSGAEPWCAQYIGDANFSGRRPGIPGAGVTVLRLYE